MATLSVIFGAIGALGVAVTIITSAVRMPKLWRKWRRPPHPFSLIPEDRLPKSVQAFRRGQRIRGALWFGFRDDHRLIVVFNWFMAAYAAVFIPWIVVGNLLRLL